MGDEQGCNEADASFGKHKRLLNARDYSQVFDAPDSKASAKQLLLLARANQGTQHRLGLVIAKKNVRLAAQRNRIKRIAISSSPRYIRHCVKDRAHDSSSTISWNRFRQKNREKADGSPLRND